MMRDALGRPINPNVRPRKPPVRRPAPERIQQGRELLDRAVTDPRAFERLMRAMWGRDFSRK